MTPTFAPKCARPRRTTCRQPLSVIFLGGGKEGTQRVVAGDDESSKVGEELATKVENDEEEVEGNNTNCGVSFGNAGRLLEVVQGGVFGQLSTRRSQSASRKARFPRKLEHKDV